MIFYILIFLFLFFLGFLLEYKYKNKILYIIISFILLTSIIGFRSITVGNDTESYHAIITWVNNYENFFVFNTGYESGFVLIVRFIGLINTGPQFILFVIAFITMFLFHLIIYKKSKNLTFSILLLFLFGIFFDSFNIVRQTLAYAILLLSIDFVTKKKILPFLLIVLLASTIHKTALIFIVIYFLNHFKIDKWFLLTVFISCFVLTLAFPYFLKIFLFIFPKYSVYLETNYLNGSNVIGIVKILLIFVFIFLSFFLTRSLYFKKNNLEYLSLPLNSKININIYAKITVSSLICIIALLILSLNANIIDRIIKNFQIILILGLPNMIYLIKKRKVRHYLYFSICAILFINLMVNFIFRPEWNDVFPYIPFWR